MKRFAIISDIHSNFDALQSVLFSIKSVGIMDIFCLGDVIGYGPDPNETVDLIKNVVGNNTIIGNHEFAVLKAEDEYIEFFNPVAKQAILYQRAELTDKSISWLRQLPESIDFEQFHFCHGSPGNLHNYLSTENDFRAAFKKVYTKSSRITFFGHTHFPACVSCDPSGTISHSDISYSQDVECFEIQLVEDLNYMINPGSVGQPRDENPLASYAIFDMERKSIAFYRVSYDIEIVMEKIKAAGLPQYLAIRLLYGC